MRDWLIDRWPEDQMNAHHYIQPYAAHVDKQQQSMRLPWPLAAGGYGAMSGLIPGYGGGASVMYTLLSEVKCKLNTFTQLLVKRSISFSMALKIQETKSQFQHSKLWLFKLFNSQAIRKKITFLWLSIHGESHTSTSTFFAVIPPLCLHDKQEAQMLKRSIFTTLTRLLWSHLLYILNHLCNLERYERIWFNNLQVISM